MTEHVQFLIFLSIGLAYGFAKALGYLPEWF